MDKAITLAEAQERMTEIVLQGDSDPEHSHAMADQVLCDLLKAHGYDDLLILYNQVPKWYA